MPDDPDFFLNPIAQATYTYDAVGNRTSMTDDFGTVNYTYDSANRMTQADGDTYKYDAAGNLVSRTSQYGDVNYSYNDDNQLTKVSYADNTYVKYDYDAFGRKVFREEQYYDLNGPGASMGQGGGKGKGNAYGQNGDNPNGADHCSSHGNIQPKTGLTLQSSGNGNGQDKSPGNGHNGGPGTPGIPGSPTGTISNYQLKTEQTRYLYDGNNLLNEYTGDGNALAQYYMGANNQVVAQQMFGFQGRKIEGYLGNLRTRGGELFYHSDPTGNVTDLTDHLGSEVLKYRYDAFGGVFTQLWTPYNQVGLTGKSYDIKASLMDYSARWYSPSAGRFTTQDTWAGNPTSPQTLNRYAYALNNPVNITDPSGHRPCPAEGDCGWGDPGAGSTFDNSGGDNSGGDTGGGYGYGGNPFGGGDSGNGGNPFGGGGEYGYGGDGGDSGGGTDPAPTPQQILEQRKQEYLAQSGYAPTEAEHHRSLQSQDMFAEGDYNYNISYQADLDYYLKENSHYGPQTDQELTDDIQRQQQSAKNAVYCHDLSSNGGNMGTDATCRGWLLSQGSGTLHEAASNAMQNTSPTIVDGFEAGINGFNYKFPTNDGLSDSEGTVPGSESGTVERNSQNSKVEDPPPTEPDGSSGVEGTGNGIKWVTNSEGLPEGGKITGYTEHGAEQVLGRDGGRGVSNEAIQETVSNPQKVVEQPPTRPGYGPTYKYVGKNAVVVLNQDGQVVTAYAKGSQSLRSVK